MKKQVRDVNEEEWATLISECIGSRKKFSEHDRRVFAMSLPKAIQWGLDHVEMIMPDNDHVKRVKSLIEEIGDKSFELYQLCENSPMLQDAERWNAQMFLDSRGREIDIKTLCDYAYYLKGYVEDSYSITSSSAPNNRAEFMTCVIICKLYQKIFGSKPSVSNSDPYKETDDGYYGTPYERVCEAVQRNLINFTLSYSTRKTACNQYKNGMSKYAEKMFPEDGKPES